MEQKLYIWQRITAVVMAPMVLLHLGLIVYAVRDGLSAAEILARTRGHAGWIGFYLLFVICVGIHVPIGVRNIMIEWWGVAQSWANRWAFLLALALLGLGLRAVWAVGR